MTVAAAPAPRRRWAKVLLIVSLALNALLAGMIVRALWGYRANLALTGGSIEAALPAFVATLPADRRDALRRAAPPDRPGTLRPLRMDVRRARAEASRAFLADPFDKPAFVAAQTRLFEAESRLRLSIQRMLPEIGERMTAGERRAYLNWHGPGPGGFRRGPGSGGPGFGGGPRGPGIEDEPGPGGPGGGPGGGPRQR